MTSPSAGHLTFIFSSLPHSCSRSKIFSFKCYPPSFVPLSFALSSVGTWSLQGWTPLGARETLPGGGTTHSFA